VLVSLYPSAFLGLVVNRGLSYEKRPALAGRQVQFCNNIQPAYRRFVVVPVVVPVVDWVIDVQIMLVCSVNRFSGVLRAA
tara:strand:- start:40 stop:279 length:240 start_codon:yes stop_codon:yes gene_type:complete